MTFEQLAAMFLNGNDFKIKTGIPHTSWHNWKRLGYIPIKSQMRIESILHGELKANLDDVPDEPVVLKRKKDFVASIAVREFLCFTESSAMTTLLNSKDLSYIEEQIGWMGRYLKKIKKRNKGDD